MRTFIALGACALFAVTGMFDLASGSYKTGVAALLLAVANALLLT